ncbi:MAG: EAL domain-containing protein [Gammaproteobacteria bacterium]
MNIPTIHPAVRVGFSLMMYTISVLLIADLFGMIPDREDMVMDARKKVCESLAVQLSVAASSDNQPLVEATLRNFVDRNTDVSAASMSRVNGEVLAEIGKFQDSSYRNISGKKSTKNLVLIPIYAEAEHWGSVNVEFADIAVGISNLLTESIIGYLLFVAIACIFGYIFILRKTLNVLDPKGIVPERVRNAFNALAEGVLILDNKERIMMANDAFAKQAARDPGDMVGQKASSLKWKLIKPEEDDRLPWLNSLERGDNEVGITLNLSTPHLGIRSLSANSAPIHDDNGKTRGALVTFDDITEVEESNILLENAVTTLQKNDVEIRRKNEELEVLASRDALTGCYNRRAFFDLLEDMFRQAVNTNTDLVCIMVDIDHFKSINDRFGHAVGDEAIRMVSEILNNCDYEGAIVGRYGGEEFCVALPVADLDQGNEVAETLRNKIKQAPKGFSEKEMTITASFGVSNAEAYMTDVAQLLEHADKALYIAKESGRDRVVTWVEGREDLPSKNTEIGPQPDRQQYRDRDNERMNADVDVRLLNHRIEQLESELKRKEAEYAKNRFNDPITNLPTQIIFEDRVSQAIAFTARSEHVMAVAIMNIDMFSRINNTLGQIVGDEFLKAVAQRLKSILRRSDTVASMVHPGQSGPSLSRLHDDEFALLLTGIDSIESVTYIIKRIQDKFTGKITVADNELYVTTTIGLAICPHDANTPKALIEGARSAQKHAKGMVGKNKYQFFSKEINKKSMEQMQLEVDMHKAIEGNQFRMVYQPKLDMETGAIGSLESLIRWRHPERGLVTPFQFIPVAERTGLIIDIGKWTLNTVCRQTRKWVDMGADDLRVSVNISGIEFTNDNFVDSVKQTLKQHNLPASHIEFEITETAVMNNLEESARIVDELRYMGITITMDDFGTGYSSFSYLGQLNFDWIKIDRNFLLEAMKHKHSRTLYDAMVIMAHEIDLKVVAEGVEKKSEYNYVETLGIDELQGYILSKPAGVLEVERMLFDSAAKRINFG